MEQEESDWSRKRESDWSRKIESDWSRKRVIGAGRE